MTCLDDEMVLGLVEGRLPPPALAAVDDHLDACTSCRDVIAQLSRARTSRVLERGHQLGRYVIGDLVGAGAMGRVYSAWQPELDRRVAIKLLQDDAPGARTRLVREAQAMARLDHPNIVGVHEVGTTDDGVYVAMDLVDGATLRAWAEQRRPWRDVVRVLIDTARGLAAVHAAGVVHRDVKPDNVIVGPDGRARLGDFGLARSGASSSAALDGDTVLAAGTPATAVAGTPAYMALEVLRGGPATEASDQFGFGVTAYEVLTGARPFPGRTWAELVRSIEAGKVAPIRGVPGWLDAAVRRCLDPGRRFDSLAAVADHLAARVQRRRPAIWLAVAATAALLASGATWLAVRGDAPVSCNDGGELAAVWSPARRAQLAALGAPVAAALDGWTAGWSAERTATCRAAAAEPAPVIAARSRCLEQRRDELSALIDELARGGRADRLLDALGELLPSECRTAVPGAADPLPLDRARAAGAAAVQAALPALRAAIALGDPRPVEPRAARLVGDAAASGHAPTLAEALLVHADALRGSARLADAATAARDALAAAERGHDDLAAARAWIARTAIAGDRRELAAAEDLGAVAAGAIDRAGAPPRLAGQLLRLRGLVAFNRGRLAEAGTLLVAARARFVEASGERSVDVASVESSLGTVARAAGDLDTAERHHRAALAIGRELRGEQHADIARDLHNLAGIARLRGQLDAAVELYRAALAIEVSTRGDRSVEAGLTHNSLGLVHMARKDWPAARAELERARDALDAAGHGDRAFAVHNLGLVAQATGDHRAALAQFTAAAQLYTDTIGGDAAAPIRLLRDRAVSEIALGSIDHARTHIVAALAAARRAGIQWIVDDVADLIETSPRPPRPGVAVVPPRPGVAVDLSPKPRPGVAVDPASPPPKPRPSVGVEPPPPVEPPTVVIEPPVSPRGSATQPVRAAEPPVPRPPQPQPKRDVGVYGSSQGW